jgi:hypothetical protein
MSIIYFSLVSAEEGDVRIEYYDVRCIFEQISEWLMEKFPNSLIVMKSPSIESHFFKRKCIPFTRSTSDTLLFMQEYTFNCPVHRKFDPHSWTMTTCEWEHYPNII